MHDLTKIAHQLDRESGVCFSVIETPKGRRWKFDYDRKRRKEFRPLAIKGAQAAIALTHAASRTAKAVKKAA